MSEQSFSLNKLNQNPISMHVVFDPNNDIQKFDSKIHDKHKVKTVIKKIHKI